MRDKKSFDATLKEIQPPGGNIGAPDEGAYAPRLHAPLSMLDGSPLPSGADAHLWDQAFAWVPEPEPPEPEPPPPPRPPPSPPPSGDPADIARELGLSDAASVDELNRSRRRFCWENHPDRHPDWPDRLANRRVALANMLIDRALEALARPKRAK